MDFWYWFLLWVVLWLGLGRRLLLLGLGRLGLGRLGRRGLFLPFSTIGGSLLGPIFLVGLGSRRRVFLRGF